VLSPIPAAKTNATSTQISSRLGLRRLLTGLALAFGLSGCLEVPKLSMFAAANDVAAEIVLRGGFRVVPPPGYCVDDQNVQSTNERIFVLIASCSALGGPDFGVPPLIMTTTLGPLPNGGFGPEARTRAAAYLRDPAGRGMLAASGRAGDVIVDEVIETRAALYLAVSDASAKSVGPVQWRGFVPVAGRLVVVSVMSGPEAPLNLAIGEAFVRDLASSLLEANVGLPPPQPSEPGFQLPETLLDALGTLAFVSAETETDTGFSKY